MNRDFNSYSASGLLSYQPKPRKVSSGKRKKSRDSSKDRLRKSKDGRLHSSPGKMMLNEYASQTSSNPLLYKNSVDDPTNLKFTTGIIRPGELAFKGCTFSPHRRPDSKKK